MKERKKNIKQLSVLIENEENIKKKLCKKCFPFDLSSNLFFSTFISDSIFTPRTLPLVLVERENGDRKREDRDQEDLICLCCRLMTTIYQKTSSLQMFDSIVTNIYSISFFVLRFAWIPSELAWLISFGMERMILFFSYLHWNVIGYIVWYNKYLVSLFEFL